MNRIALCAVAGLLWLPSATAAAPQAAPAEPPVSFGEVVEVDVVEVEAQVTDRQGRPVPGLRKEDFELFMDGRRVEIVNFREIGAAVAAPPAAQPGPSPESTQAGSTQAGPASREPLSLAVLLDNRFLDPGHRARALQQIRAFLAEHLAPGDRVLVASHGQGLRVHLGFTSDAGAVDAALNAMGELSADGPEHDRARRSAFDSLMTTFRLGKTGPGAVPCGPEIESPARSYAQEMRQDALRSVGALKYLVNSLSGMPGRQAVVYVSDGLPLTPGQELYEVIEVLCGGNPTGAAGMGAAGPGVPNEDAPVDVSGRAEAYQARQAALDAQKFAIHKEVQSLVAHANAQRVTLYPLQAGGLAAGMPGGASMGAGERVLESGPVFFSMAANLQSSLTALASGTGGQAILDTNDFRGGLGGVVDDLSSGYSLAFAPDHPGEGREHRLEVRVKRPGARVRQRESFRHKPPLERVFDRTLAALVHGYEDNPLEVSVEAGEAHLLPSGRWSLPLRIKVPLFRLAIQDRQGTFEGKLRLLVAVGGADGSATPVRQVEVPIQIPRESLLTAMGQYFLYELRLEVGADAERVALAVRDEFTLTASYVSQAVSVGSEEKKDGEAGR